MARAGIGLARVGGLAVFDTAEVRQDIEVALRTTESWLTERRTEVDQLCCGKAGQLEFVVTAGQRLRRPELLQAARRYTGLVLAESRSKGSYTTELGLHPSIYVPGLFRGEAGIGYMFLRLLDPDVLPSLLLFE